VIIDNQRLERFSQLLQIASKQVKVAEIAIKKAAKAPLKTVNNTTVYCQETKVSEAGRALMYSLPEIAASPDMIAN
jgi:hypothetical protein